MDIKKLRESIDLIDGQLVALLNDRARLAQQIGTLKRNGQKFHPAREAQVIRQALAASTGPFTARSLEAIFREIIGCCLSLEQPLRVSYLGPSGTYSEEAARARFGVPAELLPQGTLDEVVEAACRGDADVAVVPVENSTEGAVNRTLDLLLETPLMIIGEVNLPIHHQLLSSASNLSDIKTIAAHPQALAQCRSWLRQHLPGVTQLPMESNAEAAKAAKEKPEMAAIAGKLAAHQYKLPVLAKNIEDSNANTTRFLILGSLPVPATGQDRTSLICAVPNQPGSLGKLLAVLADASLNITKLEARPSSAGTWDYVFYIDIDGHSDDPVVAKAVQDLKKRASFVKVLGSYPKDAR